MTLAALQVTSAAAAGAALSAEVAGARDRFVRAGIADGEAVADAERLARHALGWDRATWLARRREAPPTGFAARYAPLVTRRERREPVSLILGEREFWGLPFAVGPSVLTPRPETELIVETALEVCADWRGAPIAIADIGTGSGCLAVTLAREFPRAVVTAVDLSEDALEVARRNAEAHGVAERIAWVHAPFEAWLGKSGGVTCDLVVANLPYVPTGELQSLPPEVRDHEPRLALDGGVDGLEPLRTLLRLAAQPAEGTPAERLPGWTPDGHGWCEAPPVSSRRCQWLIVEVGAGQAHRLGELLDEVEGLDLVDIRADLQGIPRVVVIRAGGA